MSRGAGPEDGAGPIAGGGGAIRARLLEGFRAAADFLQGLFRGRREDVAELAGPHPWEASYPEGLSWQFEIESTRLDSIVDQAVASFPNRPCLEFLGKKHSYKDLGELVAKAAKGFQELGVTKGVRVGLFLPNCPANVQAHKHHPGSFRRGPSPCSWPVGQSVPLAQSHLWHFALLE